MTRRVCRQRGIGPDVLPALASLARLAALGSVVLNAGHIEQVGSPLELYKKPANRFVAGFIGSPKMNFLDGAEAGRYQAHSIGIRPEHAERFDVYVSDYWRH